MKKIDKNVKNIQLERNEKLMEIKRDRFLKQLVDKRNDGMVKVVTGGFYAGKSYLLDSLVKKLLLHLYNCEKTVKILT